MTPEAHNIQFSRQIWQTVSENAHHCLDRREFSPEHSRIENLRCVDFVEETINKYGKQVWFFEAIGVDPTGRRRVFHGALEFSVQYGLLEPAQSVMFEDDDARDRFLDSVHRGTRTRRKSDRKSSSHAAITLCGLFVVLAGVWVYAYMSLVR